MRNEIEKSEFLAHMTNSNVENRGLFSESSFQIGSNPEMNLNTTAWNSATNKFCAAMKTAVY